MVEQNIFNKALRSRLRCRHAPLEQSGQGRHVDGKDSFITGIIQVFRQLDAFCDAAPIRIPELRYRCKAQRQVRDGFKECPAPAISAHLKRLEVNNRVYGQLAKSRSGGLHALPPLTRRAGE